VFDLVCAFDIVEHVDDDDRAVGTSPRLRASGHSFFPSRCTRRVGRVDEFVGHRRRYEPARLLAKLGQHGFAVESSAVYGMQPESSCCWILACGACAPA